jgi:hypothetical protein
MNRCDFMRNQSRTWLAVFNEKVEAKHGRIFLFSAEKEEYIRISTAKLISIIGFPIRYQGKTQRQPEKISAS